MKVSYNSILTKQHYQKQTKSEGFVNFLPKTPNINLIDQTIIPKNDFVSSNAISSLYQAKFTSQEGYGYSVDAKGFMGADFNKTADLQQDFKLHKSTLDAIVLHNQKHPNYTNTSMDTRKDNMLFGEDSFANIDLADTIKQYYKIFDQISARVISKGKEFYSNEDLAKMPKGYFSKDKKMDHFEYLMGRMTSDELDGLTDRSNEKVTHIFRTVQDVNDARKLINDLSDINVEVNGNFLDFSPEVMTTEHTNPYMWVSSAGYDFKPDMSVYDNKQGYTKEQIFVAFLKNEQGLVLQGGTTRITDEALNVYKSSLILTKQDRSEIGIPKAYYDEILSGKKDLKDILARILKLRNLKLRKDHTLEGLASKIMDVLKEFDERTKTREL
ncbi:Cj0814 family flagellar-dependent secreted protein [Campylobacter concisus]|uniref:Cj0814 family flagellar-dependent secreted protein n=1 Tax=Campylobacter concisus TaxID=199 RepID=UPI000D31A957|nr:hypothetical protein [Campylobacter concisus]